MTQRAYAVTPDEELGAAIVGGRVAQWAATVLVDPTSTEERRQVAEMVRATCARLRQTNEREAEHLVAALDSAGIAVETTTSDQRHMLTLDVHADDARDALATCEAAGYGRPRAWRRGAERSFWRVADEALLTCTTTTRTMLVRLRWRRSANTLTRRIFRPTPADWDMIELPALAWWGYPLVRPLRLTLERSGLRRNDHAILEPTLATPSDLLEPLLDIGHVGPDDLLVDVGCGDGRIVVAAVLSRRCRAIGVELSAAAAAEATELAVREGVSDRVEIVNADLRDVRIDAVTVAILFVPMVLASGLVHDLLGRLPRGARIVLHEQGARPPELPTPDASFAVVADEAMTVAHRWVAGSADPARHGTADEGGTGDSHRRPGSG